MTPKRHSEIYWPLVLRLCYNKVKNMQIGLQITIFDSPCHCNSQEGDILYILYCLMISENKKYRAFNKSKTILNLDNKKRIKKVCKSKKTYNFFKINIIFKLFNVKGLFQQIFTRFLCSLFEGVCNILYKYWSFPSK